eukprot:TRINITY_DN12953_c0_g1_i1.p3 TRINITY_DN12953_c0_g1~~TRINITY_DN12953_c0_g1_i1.p3  ORF type:complete len:134 (-),score=60.00 TRINITY_DN12953_c0_g1_i1:82-483(-)
MIRRPPRSTHCISSAASDVYKRQTQSTWVNIAGKRTSLAYLNHQLGAVPGIVDGAFFLPDEEGPDGITRLTAFIVAPGMTARQVTVALRERIDAIFLPRPLVLVDELPRNSTGKLPRVELQALYAEKVSHGSR